MRVDLCGVRGSIPAPGAEFVRYGGNTSCVALAHGNGRPTLVIDAGTGIRKVSALLEGDPYNGAILLSHLHWDHTQGLPFFASGDNERARVDLYLPEQGDAEAVLERTMSPPHFPIAPSQLRGEWRFSGLEAGTTELEGFEVTALDIPHKGGRTFGFRVADDHCALAYLSDHGPIALGPGPYGTGEFHEAAMTLAGGADVLLHDAQHTDEELPARAHFGHSAASYGVALARRAGAGAVVLFHHDPSRTDDEIDEIVASFADAAVAVEGAREGRVFAL